MNDTKRCPDCGGTGKYDCPFCGSEGVVDCDGHDCGHMHDILCPWCYDETLDCPACEGTGRVRVADGDGQITLKGDTP